MHFMSQTVSFILNIPSHPIIRLPRSLHRRLLSMHVTSTLSQSAGVAKYLLPVSDTSCVVTHRILVALLLLYDVSKLD